MIYKSFYKKMPRGTRASFRFKTCLFRIFWSSQNWLLQRFTD